MPKIKRVEIIRTNVPFRESYRSGVTFDFIKSKPHIFVKIHTDNGLIGIGEASEDRVYSGETVETIADIIKTYLAPLLIGKEPFDVKTITEEVNKVIKPFSNNFAKFAVETALYDLMGKSTNLPIYDLLGGRCRVQIPLGIALPIVEPELAAKKAEEAVKSGIKSITQKIGLNPEDDVERVRRVRERVGYGIRLAVDANQLYTPRTAIRNLKKMERFELEYAEQPVAAWNLDGMAAVARGVDIPIAADESLFSVHDALNLVKYRAAHIFVIQLAKHGGICNSTKIASIAEAAGIECRHGGSYELGVGSAAAAHYVSAITNLDVPFHEMNGPLYHTTDMIRDTLKYGNGFLEVPKGPGLGVELDDQKVESHRV